MAVLLERGEAIVNRNTIRHLIKAIAGKGRKEKMDVKDIAGIK